MACPHCGDTKAGKWGTHRVMCHGCNRTYKVGKYIRPSNVEKRQDSACPNCGDTGRHNIRTRRGGKPVMECGKCHKLFYHAVGVVPDTTEASILVVTSAVNDTRVHTAFLKTLRQYCDHRKARLVVIPLRYKNPTRQGEGEEVTWHPSLTPYLCDRRLKVCSGLQILADIKTQPTAVNPLSGMDTITGTDCGVFGHTKVSLSAIPTRGHELPKLLLTTGAVTVAQYSDTKAGKKGEFHHVLGAVVIETGGDLFHLRHIHAASDGSFIDLDTKWTVDGPKQAPPALALVMGDIHAERADPDVLKATAEIQTLLRPKNLVLHDVLDFGSASHHNGYFDRFLRRVTGRDRVGDELRTTAEVIDSLHRKGQQTIVVSSNHHDHLGRWLADHRNGDDVQNAGIYHRAKSAVLDAIERHGKVPNIFALVIGPMLKKPATFLTDKDSLTVGGVELAYHGDKGPNGSRGSAKAFDRIGAKTIIGHSHSPAIVGGCFQTGTSSMLDMGYNVGPSSWLHSHVVVYASGKRSHLHVINGTWRASAVHGQGKPGAAKRKKVKEGAA